MNFRNTFVLFGLFLGMLWLFGLMVSIKRTNKEETFVMPAFHGDQDVLIVDSLQLTRGGGDKKEEYVFTRGEGGWKMSVPPFKTQVRVEEFRVKNIVRQIADAQDAAEVDVSGSLSSYGLDQPTTTVTIKAHQKDKAEQTWNFFVGKQSRDKTFYYVTSSESPRAAHGVRKTSIDTLFFDDANTFRPGRLFEAVETEVKAVELKQPGGKELELKRTEEATWQFVRPPLGEAEYGSAPAPPPNKFAVTPPKAPEDAGVKALLTSILSLRVDADNFVP